MNKESDVPHRDDEIDQWLSRPIQGPSKGSKAFLLEVHTTDELMQKLFTWCERNGVHVMDVEEKQ